MREMKDSGIEWIGEIPSGWETKKVNDCFSQKKAKAHQEDPVVLTLARSGIKVRDMSNAEGQFAVSYYDYNPVDIGDMLINPMDLVSGDNCNLSKVKGVISPAYVNLRYKKGVNPEYFKYYFKYQYWSMAFFAHGKGVSFENRWTLNTETLMKFPILVPTKQEQNLIANYLDKKCNQIDALTEKIQTQINLLQDYKKSVIFDAVSKGINSTRSKRATTSNVWKEIPEGWEIKKIKYLFEIKKRIAGKEGFDVLSVTQQGLKVKNIESGEGQLADNYSGYQFVYLGDFVMNHMDLLTGWVDLSNFFGVTSPDYRVFVVRNHDICDSQYFKYLFQCCYLNRIFYSLGQGVATLGRWRLPTSAFNNFEVPFPTVEEQKEIADYLDSTISKTDELIKKHKKQLQTLHDYKKSLIYEYVTGKKEVPSDE